MFQITILISLEQAEAQAIQIYYSQAEDVLRRLNNFEQSLFSTEKAQDLPQLFEKSYTARVFVSGQTTVSYNDKEEQILFRYYNLIQSQKISQADQQTYTLQSFGYNQEELLFIIAQASNDTNNGQNQPKTVYISCSKEGAQYFITGFNVNPASIPGIMFNNSDEDILIDLIDPCPKRSGGLITEGCPDEDGDGVSDDEDKCPTLKGSLKGNGCPDSDQDGIYDWEDLCPATALDLKVDSNGCPIKSELYSKFPAAYSLLAPGLGHYMISENKIKKPYYLITIAGIGALATGLSFNIDATKNYNLYLAEPNRYTAQPFFDKASSSQKKAKGFYAASAFIWAADFFWTYKQSSKIKGDRSVFIYPNSNGLTIRYGF